MLKILPLLLLAVVLLHTALVSALIKLDYLDVAEKISFRNADVYEAQALKFRQLAIDEKHTAAGGSDSLEASFSYWQQAIELRPLWPYYHLGALDIEVLRVDFLKTAALKKDKAAINQRIKTIIELAPNERGLDKSLLILAFISWDWLEQGSKDWLLARLSIVRHSVLKEVFNYAKQAQNQGDICAYLAWKKVKKLCSN
jgi:hypothetical protein